MDVLDRLDAGRSDEYATLTDSTPNHFLSDEDWDRYLSKGVVGRVLAGPRYVSHP